MHDYAMGLCMRQSYGASTYFIYAKLIHKVHTSPSPNKSSAIEHFECDGAVQMKDGFSISTYKTLNGCSQASLHVPVTKLKHQVDCMAVMQSRLLGFRRSIYSCHSCIDNWQPCNSCSTSNCLLKWVLTAPLTTTFFFLSMKVHAK